jgi:hypothetical protein
VPSKMSFVWPAAGAMQVIPLPGGGCNIKITFTEKGTVRSIGKGLILSVRNVPTRRIARQYEILIRHEDGFESSYSIVDQTPYSPSRESHCLKMQGMLVEHERELYEINHGGFLHFQLSRAGKLVDPRQYIRQEFEGTVNIASAPTDSR